MSDPRKRRKDIKELSTLYTSVEKLNGYLDMKEVGAIRAVSFGFDVLRDERGVQPPGFIDALRHHGEYFTIADLNGNFVHEILGFIHGKMIQRIKVLEAQI